MSYSHEELQDILEQHSQWLRDSRTGKCADLRCADLSSADLRRANLRRANLSSADLTDADLSSADLTDANLRRTKLRRANLTDANLRRANLRRANLSSADLTCADLTGANLTDANLSSANLSSANLTDANLRYIRGSATAGLIVVQTEYHSVIDLRNQVLAFGCEQHSLADWPRVVVLLCHEHEPKRAAYFEAEILSIIKFAQAMVELIEKGEAE